MEDNIFDKVHEVDMKKNHGRVLYRLCHECYCFSCASGCKRRSETCSETYSLFDDRVEQRS